MTSDSSCTWRNQTFIQDPFAFSAQPQPVSTITVLAISITLPLLLPASLLGNGFLCYLVFNVRHLRTKNNLMVADLTIVDILHVIVNGTLFTCSMPFQPDLLRGKLWGLMMFVSHMYFSYVTLTTMFMMLLDRYLAIKFPFKHKSLKTQRNVLKTICAKWFLSLIPILIICGPMYRMDLGDCPPFHYRASYVREPIFQTSCYVTGPPLLLATTCLYVMTRRKLKLNNNTVFRRSNLQRNKLRAEKALNTIFITLLSFVLCYATTFLIIVVPSEYLDNLRLEAVLVYSILFIPGTVNPYIYLFRVRSFKDAIKVKLHCCSHRVENHGGNHLGEPVKPTSNNKPPDLSAGQAAVKCGAHTNTLLNRTPSLNFEGGRWCVRDGRRESFSVNESRSRSPVNVRDRRARSSSL